MRLKVQKVAYGFETRSNRVPVGLRNHWNHKKVPKVYGQSPSKHHIKIDVTTLFRHSGHKWTIWSSFEKNLALGRGRHPFSTRELESTFGSNNRTENSARRPVRFDPALWNLETGSKGLRKVTQSDSIFLTMQWANGPPTPKYINVTVTTEFRIQAL